MGNQWNPEKFHILRKEQPLSGLRMKQKGLRSKHAFEPKYNFLILLEEGQKDVLCESLGVK